MPLSSRTRSLTLLAGLVTIVGAGLFLGLDSHRAVAVGEPAGSPTAGRATPVAAVSAKGKPNPERYPFGAPTGHGDYRVPPPPGSSTLGGKKNGV